MINTIPCTPDEAKGLIKKLSGLNLSFMLWGATGVGKSECIRQLAAELDAELRDIRLCQKQPTDIGGLPALDHQTQQTVFYSPAFLAPRSDKKAVILFFDEISLAPDDTKAAVLGILEERRQGNIKLPENWIIVAAGNRPEDLANARNLGAAANRRLLHIVIEPQLESTLAHFVKIGVAPEVLAFLKVFPQHLSGEAAARTAKHELYPRPASWEKVSRILGELKGRQTDATACRCRNHRRCGGGGIYAACRRSQKYEIGGRTARNSTKNAIENRQILAEYHQRFIRADVCDSDQSE